MMNPLSPAPRPGLDLVIEDLEDLDAPSFGDWLGGLATGIAVGIAAVGVGVLVT
jgi:hypothetical protein